MSKWIGSKPRLVIINRKDMVSKSDQTAWDRHYAAEGAAAAAAQAAAQQRAAAKAAAKAAAAAAGDSGAGASIQQQQQDGEDEGQQQQQLDQHADPQPPSLPQQVLWTDGKTGEAGCLCQAKAAGMAEVMKCVRNLRRELQAPHIPP